MWFGRWQDWWAEMNKPEGPTEPPQDYDIGHLTADELDFMLDAARRHPKFSPVKKASVDKLETARPVSRLSPGSLPWDKITKEAERQGVSEMDILWDEWHQRAK